MHIKYFYAKMHIFAKNYSKKHDETCLLNKMTQKKKTCLLSLRSADHFLNLKTTFLKVAY